jgi:tetratricopeptide (TPR) repeat protein
MAYTWYIAGLIGYTENDVELKKQMIGQKFDADKKGKAILESYDYFLKAYDLDALPDAKGKVKIRYQKEIKEKVSEYYTNQANLLNYGAQLFEKKDYKEAINVFELFMSVPDLKMMNNELKKDSTYFMIKYYTALACVNAELNDKAITYFEDLKDDGYEEIIVHQLLYEQYYKKNDTVNFVNTLKEGVSKFPQEVWFLQNLINYYIFTAQTEEALVYVNRAIESDPNSAQYQYVKGNLAESMGKLEDARTAFDKALELDPTIADAHAGLGRLYFNKAVKMSEEANDIKDNKKYNAAKSKADDVFKQSIPFFKKAAELKPEELEYKRTLKTLYYRLQMDKDFNEISKELSE